MVLFISLLLVLVVTLIIVSERVVQRDPVRASAQLRRRLRSSSRSRH